MSSQNSMNPDRARIRDTLEQLYKAPRTERAASEAPPPKQPLSASPPKLVGKSTLTSLLKRTGSSPHLSRKKNDPTPKKATSSPTAARRSPLTAPVVEVERLSLTPSQEIPIIPLPEDEGKAIKLICTFFDTQMGTKEPAKKVVGAILSEKEEPQDTSQNDDAIPKITFKRAKVFLKALENVYIKALTAPKPKKRDAPTQRDLFFDELIYLIAYSDPRTIYLVCQFFINIDNFCDSASDNNNIPHSSNPIFQFFKTRIVKEDSTLSPLEKTAKERFDFAEKLFQCFRNKERLTQMLAAMVATEIQGEKPEEILRKEYFSTYLAGHIIFKPILRDILNAASKELQDEKNGVDWPSRSETAIKIISFLVKPLKESSEIKELSNAISTEVRKKLTLFQKLQQDEIIQNILKNLIFLRTICPHFILQKNDIGIAFAKYLMCLLAPDKSYSIPAPSQEERAFSNEKKLEFLRITQANKVFRENEAALRGIIDETFTDLASDQ